MKMILIELLDSEEMGFREVIHEILANSDSLKLSEKVRLIICQYIRMQ